MNRRSPEIFRALFEEILDRAMKCAPSHKFKFHNPLYIIDSTTINLCLTKYGWAYYRLAASSIAGICKQRWQLELFFKWIKQNLKIKSFPGTSENAVMTKTWVALIHYLLVTYIKFLHGFKLSLTEITNRIRDTLMQNLFLLEILCLDKKTIQKPPDWNQPEQLELFTQLLC